MVEKTLGIRQRLVVIESPYAGDIDINVEYARACMRDSLLKGEHPFASHLLYTQEGILRDNVPTERAQGIQAGLLWGQHAEAVLVYTDRGITGGMKLGIKAAEERGTVVEYRSLGGRWSSE